MVAFSTQPLEVSCLSVVHFGVHLPSDTQPADNGFNGAGDVEHLTRFPEPTQVPAISSLAEGSEAHFTGREGRDRRNDMLKVNCMVLYLNSASLTSPLGLLCPLRLETGFYSSVYLQDLLLGLAQSRNF